MSKKLLTLGLILGMAACAGEDEELELEDEGFETEEPVMQPAPPAMDTSMMMDTMMMDTMADTMGM